MFQFNRCETACCFSTCRTLQLTATNNIMLELTTHLMMAPVFTQFKQRKSTSMCWVRTKPVHLVTRRSAAPLDRTRLDWDSSIPGCKAICLPLTGGTQSCSATGGKDSRTRDGIGKRTPSALGNLKGHETPRTTPKGALHCLSGRKIGPAKAVRSLGKTSTKAQILQKAGRRTG